MIIKTRQIDKPKIDVLVKEGETHLWKYFHNHHYMTANKELKDSLPPGAKFYTFYFLENNQEILVGCAGVIFQISTVQEAKRLTRVVVLPEYQGLGFGKTIVNTLGEYYTDKGFLLYGATYHPRLGNYRENSPLWKGSHYNLREFKLNPEMNNNGMTGLRDGIKMYRHIYNKHSSYNLEFDVLEFSKLKRTVKELEVILSEENYKEYSEVFAVYKKMAKEFNIEINPKLVLGKILSTDEHQKGKDSHKRLFNKNKRKPLTSAERKMKKKERKER